MTRYWNIPLALVSTSFADTTPAAVVASRAHSVAPGTSRSIRYPVSSSTSVQ